MNTQVAKNKRSKTKLIVILFFIIILAAAITLFFLEKTHITNFIQIEKNTKTEKIEPSAQSDFTNQKERTTTQNKKDEGFVTDTKGVDNTIPNKSEWITSSDDNITVYTPGKNSVLSTGGLLSGESTSKKVSFRLIDNVSGMIAQGKLDVINNKFSGVFDFKTTASEGRLDVYIENSNGSESSVIEIPIRLKQ